MRVMAEKLRKFFDAFRTGGVEHSAFGSAIEVSAKLLVLSRFVGYSAKRIPN